MKFSSLMALCAVLALSGCGAAPSGSPSGSASGSPSDQASGKAVKEGVMMTGLRTVLAFKACTGRLEDKFKLGPIKGVTSSDMDQVAVGTLPGDWDIKFTADVTEKESGRVSRYKGVCHVRRDTPTILEATFVKEITPGVGKPGDVRRVRP